jgi:hypothetical protein
MWIEGLRGRKLGPAQPQWMNNIVGPDLGVFLPNGRLHSSVDAAKTISKLCLLRVESLRLNSVHVVRKTGEAVSVLASDAIVGIR